MLNEEKVIKCTHIQERRKKEPGVNRLVLVFIKISRSSNTMREQSEDITQRAKTSGFLDEIPWAFRLWGRRCALSGLQKGPIFGQKLAAQSTQLLLEFLKSSVLFLLLPKHLLLVIVGVQFHPVIHHSHHVFFRDKGVIKDLGVGWGQKGGIGKGECGQRCEVPGWSYKRSHPLFLDLHSLFLDIWTNATIALPVSNEPFLSSQHTLSPSLSFETECTGLPADSAEH